MVRRARHFAAISTVSLLLALVAPSAVLPERLWQALAEPASKVPAPLDPGQLQKILKHLDEKGITRELPIKVTAQLGVTKGEETLIVREVAFERASYQHGFYKSLKAHDDHLLLAFRTPEKKWTTFLTNSKLKLIAAVSWNAGEMPEIWGGSEADQAFANELAYWATLAELF
jgi:hypothetical protein